MNARNKLSAIAIAICAASCVPAWAGTASSTMTVSGTLTTACEVSGTSTISFGNFAALSSTGNKTADSGSSFQVACSNSASPTIYATGTRKMLNGTYELPFNLSLTSGAASDDLPSSSGTAAALTVTQDGTLQDVAIYAKTLASDFRGLPSGAYTTNVTVSVAY